ncbi:MAG TPA: AmmeMemoRadiSam system radical SAM enzyme [bacterium]|nr:AmmeMemoRadiSam system radical SAM enzyme [bacterium]
MNRREFLRAAGVGACGVAGCMLASGGGRPGVLYGAETDADHKQFYKEAMFYEKLPDKRTGCVLCPRKCVVEDGGRGYCRARENVGGKYYTIVYGRVCTYHVDPIEKKPLFHFLPGTSAFSLATVGCNLECKFCQNWEISQERPENLPATDMPPAKVVENTLQLKMPTIAYTYTEPTTFYEYMLDTARLGRQQNLKSVMISAGYINPDPLAGLAPALDAIKIDLKGFTPDFYANVCGVTLRPVLDTIAMVKKSGTWLEVVHLVVPTLSDNEKEIDAMCKWMHDNVGDEVPLHFTRFYPMYKLANLPPTPVSSVERAREIALARGLKYVYVGNVPAQHPGESTYCPKCGKMVIERAGYTILSNRIHSGKCQYCHTPIAGVWS